ncbi:TetR/AcrR family transcriptional regulator [Pseudobacteriovorax antillogorgiicola]|uniref:Transcriptional regulator, TetR family n=1 Tax=Pseudobacteriovorax antillogorgiicola TaxID=1513793 RepID=A0A1Y6CVY2_9BACT|nr:TetR/AcrR family transcriptional regulator [Pseudobacteriovorax antillogorgiicola]TCS42225.1 TetR family transcriptional regulator [Pseudobacteriovorax antillogorgiicola]SMF82755.1 transcriptional regulator, TetR family [Pseudobacteriovorax antillogorgiicola]
MPRVKEFDPDKALDQAMQVFWRHGYEGTTVSHLMAATGLLKGSLYGAFGSKEKLFLKALSKYGEDFRKKGFQKQDPLDYLQQFFQRLVDEGGHTKGERGCLIMNSCVEFGRQDHIRAKLSGRLFQEVEKNLQSAVVAAIAAKQMPEDTDVDALVCRLVGGAFALREMGKFKRDRAYLSHIANGVLDEIGLKII